MKKLLHLLTLLVAVGFGINGCSSEVEAPTAASIVKGQLVPVADNFMADSLGDTSSTAYYYVYLPPGYDPNRAAGYPTLYLLNGFGGNENYFVALFSATDAADWLYSRGEMDPMIIVFPSGHNGFGGGFYTDSWHPSVKGSEAHIMRVIGEVDANYNTDPTPAKRAIGGHSMGGYGAMRLALRFPNTFGSIGVLAGPLAFWGTMPSSTQFKGLAEILPSVLQETGYDTILAANPAGDLTAYRQMMYPAATRRVTSMMFAAAAAFSPTNPGNMEPISLVGYGVDLPINVDGQLYMPTWNRWLTHDPLAMFAGGAAANLAGVNIYLDAGARDDLGFAYSHDVFAGALLQAGMPASVKLTFVDASDGAGGTVPADHTLHTYERIKKMLIWQSNQF